VEKGKAATLFQKKATENPPLSQAIGQEQVQTGGRPSNSPKHYIPRGGTLTVRCFRALSAFISFSKVVLVDRSDISEWISSKSGLTMSGLSKKY
jgi:hypothetical protein